MTNTEKTESRSQSKRYLWLGVVVVVIVGAWLFLRSDAGLGNRYADGEFGLLRDQFEDGKEYSSAQGFYAAPFRLEGSDGSVIDFQDDLLGNNVMLVFGATWCSFCKREIPDIERIAEEGQVKVVEISINEKLDTVLDHLEENNITQPWYLDRGSQVANWYFLAGTPTHVFIDEEGVIQRRETGFRSGEDLDEAVADLLAS